MPLPVGLPAPPDAPPGRPETVPDFAKEMREMLGKCAVEMAAALGVWARKVRRWLVRQPPAIVAALNALTGAATDAARVDFSNATYGAKEFVAPLIRRVNQFRAGDFDHAPFLDLGAAGRLAYRAANKLSRLRLSQGLSRRKPVTRFVRDQFRGRFDASNAALQAYVAVDLAGLGYPMGNRVSG